MSKSVYFDYNSTTPVDPRVVDAMLPFFTERFGNPSSTSHPYGWDADMAVNVARRQVALLLGGKSKDIIFTSGATESNNIVLQGKILPLLRSKKPAHLITSTVEHKCILDTAKALQKWGAEVTFLEPDSVGRVSAKKVEGALRQDTVLVSLIMANNEIGTINPIAEIGALLEEKGIAFHTDAAQAVGKIPVRADELKTQFISGSAQKMYGPKGVGFLFINKANPLSNLEPIMFGGSQESGLRPGTLNVPGIVGLGKCCDIALTEMPEEKEKLTRLQKKVLQRITDLDPDIVLNGCPENRLPTNLNLTFRGLNGDIFSGLTGLACSSGSACSLGEASYVLKAIGRTPEESKKTLRLGLGRFTTEAEIEAALQEIAKLVSKSRAISNN